MIISSGVQVLPYFTILRVNPADDNKVAIEVVPGAQFRMCPGMTEGWVLRLRNTTGVTATWGVVLNGYGVHHVDHPVSWGGGELNKDFQMGAMTEKANSVGLSAGAGNIRFNCSVAPGAWLEVRGHVTWGNDARCPAVQLQGWIAGATTLEVARDGGGIASPAVTSALII